MSSCELMDMAELSGGMGQAGMVPGGRGAPPLSNRDLLKAKLQKDKFMTKPLSEIVANETEVRHALCAAEVLTWRLCYTAQAASRGVSRMASAWTSHEKRLTT